VSHVLVIANETAASPTLLAAVRGEAGGEGDIVTVIAPVNEPRSGYVVYESTRRTSARRRLDKTVEALRGGGIHAQGFVVETGPVQAVKDALAQLEPKIDEIVVSTHPPASSGWMRRDVVQDIERLADAIPVKHIVADAALEGGGVNVLVIANQTVVSEELLDTIRARHAEGPASFLIVVPASDDEDEDAADRRLRQTLTHLRTEGIDAHGQIVHPDPYTAAIQTTHDERIDEIIVSTFSGERSGWLRRDLVARLRKDTGKSVQHVVSDTRVPA
jgi:predicted deacetylase